MFESSDLCREGVQYQLCHEAGLFQLRYGPSGASQGGNDTFGLETYQRDRFSPSIPALRCGLTLEGPRDMLRRSR